MVSGCEKDQGEGGCTEKTGEVLCAVGVDSARVLAVGLVPELVHVVVLGTFKPVRDSY